MNSALVSDLIGSSNVVYYCLIIKIIGNEVGVEFTTHTIIIVTTVTVMGFVLISATMLVIGFVCGCWFRCTNPYNYKGSSERAACHRSQQCIENSSSALYEQVYIDSQEGGLDLKENVAYVSTQEIKTLN